MTLIMNADTLKAEREQWLADQADLLEEIGRLRNSIGYRIEQAVRRWLARWVRA